MTETTARLADTATLIPLETGEVNVLRADGLYVGQIQPQYDGTCWRAMYAPDADDRDLHRVDSQLPLCDAIELLLRMPATEDVDDDLIDSDDEDADQDDEDYGWRS